MGIESTGSVLVAVGPYSAADILERLGAIVGPRYHLAAASMESDLGATCAEIDATALLLDAIPTSRAHLRLLRAAALVHAVLPELPMALLGWDDPRVPPEAFAQAGVLRAIRPHELATALPAFLAAAAHCASHGEAPP